MTYMVSGVSHRKDCRFGQDDTSIRRRRGHGGQIMTFARCAAAQYALIRDTSSRIKMTGLEGSTNPKQVIPTV